MKIFANTTIPFTLVAILFFDSCATTSRFAFEKRGVASWYGSEHQGKKTASGERFDMNQMTAAHRTLPFGTWVRVHNLKNDRDVRVRINDRGPFSGARIIDLSRKAAHELGIIQNGEQEVELTLD